MKNLKKFLALFMVAAMTFSFVACAADSDKEDKDNDKNVEDSDDKDDDKNDKEDKEDKDDADSDAPTAMEILESISMKDTTGGKISFVLDAEGGLDMKQMLLDSGITEEEIQDAIDAGEIEEDYLNLVIDIAMDFEIEANEDYSHIVGTLDMEAMGEVESESYESYVDNTNDEYSITYEYDEFFEEWTAVKEYNDVDDDTELSDIDMIFDYIENAEIVSETDDVYVLSVELDLYQLYMDESETVDDLVDESETDIEDMVGEMADIFDALGTLDITVEVEKETNYLAAIRVDFAGVVDSLLSVIPETEDGMNYADYITVDTLSLDIEISDINNVEVEIPQDIIDEAGEVSDDIEDDFIDDEDDVNVSGDDTFVLYNYSDEVIATMNVPDGYVIDTEFSDDTMVKVENDFSYIYIQTFAEDWAETIINGEEYVSDSEYFTRDEAEEVESVETDLGTIRVFIRTYSSSDDYSEEYYQDISYVLVEDGEIVFSADGVVKGIEESGYTIETFIQTMLQQ